MIENKQFYDNLDPEEPSAFRDIARSPKNLNKIKRVIEDIRNKYLLDAAQPLRWLDVGCGTGDCGSIARAMNMRYMGVDCSGLNVLHALEKYPEHEFMAGDWPDIPVAAKFHLCTFISSLHHFEDWKAALRKARECMLPDGVIYVEHEPTRFFAFLFKQYWLLIKRVDRVAISAVEIHWFGRPSIRPSELPPGETVFHCDFLPGAHSLGLKTSNPFLGAAFPTFRKIIQARAQEEK